jgi:TorA maturation chaperone TorD
VSQKSQTIRLSDGIAEEDLLRADLYAMLAQLLARPPSQDLIDRAAALSGDDSDIGQGIAALARVASATKAKSAEREYNSLFIGLGRGELLPYASFYLTGFLNEKPLARLRTHMAQFGIERSADVKEPEDHIATLCEIMAGLIRGTYGDPLTLEDQHAFFNTHVATWAGHFFTDLEGAEVSVFYAPVGKIGRAFMEIEIEAFRMEA